MMPPPDRFSQDDIVIGRSPRMRAIFDYIALVGPGQGTVLVTGESGTGKELVAHAIHEHSPRRRQPFVPVSCALFSDSLIESELFGHERGAFTGAVGARQGRFERAQGGTIFLDDIDDVPLSMQVKLLRALQNRTIERLGSQDATPIDVRVIAGTKRDLRQLVREGRFREDLFYRLNVLSIELPPLRERREDILTLADHFFRRFFARAGRPAPPVSDGVRKAFLAYDWPGNVRELENACERAAESCTCHRVSIGCIAASVLFHTGQEAMVAEPATAAARPVSRPSEAPVPMPAVATTPANGLTLDDHLRRVETELIRWALGESRGNKSRAAALLGVKRSTLGDRIARCGIRECGI
jgi:sigma-54 dependent transcriptional regulator, flagellar regulatory protein